MKKRFDEEVLDCWKLPDASYLVKMRKDEGLDDNWDFENTMLANLGVFILSNSKRIMKKFLGEINSFYNKIIYYGNPDSLYMVKKHCDVLDKTKLVGEELCQGKNLYRCGGVFYSLFLAPKTKDCSTIDKFGIVQEHKTFTGFNDSERLLYRSQYFKMIESKKNICVVA